MSAPVRGPEVDTIDIASPRSPENDDQEKNPDVSEHDSGADMSEEEEENRQRLMGEKVSLLPDFKADLPDWLDESLITDTSDGSSVRVEGKSILQIWFLTHLHNPYPDESDRQLLEAFSGVHDWQGALWFSNTRRRNKSLLLVDCKQIQTLQRWFLRHLREPLPSPSDLSRLAAATSLSETIVNDWMREARNLMRRFVPCFTSSGVIRRGVAQPRWLCGGFERPARGTVAPMATLQEAPGAPRASRALPKLTVKVLNDWFDGHIHHPYPSAEEQHLLVHQTGLTETQVLNWLANARRRSVRGQPGEPRPFSYKSRQGPTPPSHAGAGTAASMHAAQPAALSAASHTAPPSHRREGRVTASVVPRQMPMGGFMPYAAQQPMAGMGAMQPKQQPIQGIPVLMQQQYAMAGAMQPQQQFVVSQQMMMVPMPSLALQSQGVSGPSGRYDLSSPADLLSEPKGASHKRRFVDVPSLDKRLAMPSGPLPLPPLTAFLPALEARGMEEAAQHHPVWHR